MKRLPPSFLKIGRSPEWLQRLKWLRQQRRRLSVWRGHFGAYMASLEREIETAIRGNAPVLTPQRKAIWATVASVLLHGVLFAILAVSTRFTPDYEAAARDLAAVVEEEVAEPLEITFQPAPPEQSAPVEVEATPEPLQTAQQAGVEAEVITLRSTLDPEGLKESEEAPENAEITASHHAKRGRSEAAPKPKPTPLSPEAAETVDPSASLFRVASAGATTSPAEGVEGEDAGDDEEGGTYAAIGAWQQAVGNAIGQRFNFYRQSKKEALLVGTVLMKFKVDAAGKVSDVRVHSNTAGPNNVIYATRSIIEANIPPIPPDRVARLPQGQVDMTLRFTIYPEK